MLSLGAGLLACLAAAPARAQESIRPSGTGAQAAEARRQEAVAPHGDFIRLGPVSVDASAGVELEYNDNVGISEQNRQSDFIVRPQFHVDGEWKVTSLNTLRLGLGAGYAKYIDHPNLDARTLLIDPGSQIGFDLFIGDNLRLNFHDRIEIVENPIDDPALSNTARFARLQNSAGVTAIVALNDLNLVFGYDHFNYDSLSSEFDFLNRKEEQFFGSARLRTSDALFFGAEGSLALVSYQQAFNNDATTWTAGVFTEASVIEYTKLRLSGGYQDMSFSQSGSNGDQSDAGSWYANLTAAQRLGQYWSHTLTVGREARLGLSVNFEDYVYARYVAYWRMNALITSGFDAFIEDIQESGGQALSAEKAFRWGGGVSLSMKVANRTTLGLRYHYVNKDSNLLLRSYYQNVGTLSLSYTF